MPSHANGLGDVFNVIAVASGVHVPLQGRAEAISFLVYDAAGDQSLTLKESIAGASEQNLAVIDTIYEAPGVGGTWTKTTQTAAATYAHSDATNDLISVTVYADQLSDLYDSLELTVTGTGPVTWALLHGLNYKRKPENLPSNI